LKGNQLTHSRTALDTLVWLIQDAFDGDPDQSLLANLRGLREEDWTALPPGGERSVAEVLEHVGWAKWMYEDYAFGSAALRGDRPPLIPADGASSRPRSELMEWLMAGHDKWLASIRSLSDDSELDQDRLTNWGDRLPTRGLIRIMIGHDFYHAGEINHIRALLQGTDRWPY
jgi:hypothetical protein